MHNLPKPSVAALSGTPITMTSGEGPSEPMAWQATDDWVPLQDPARDGVAPILQVYSEDPNTYDRCLDPYPTDAKVSNRCLIADPTDICEMCLGPDLPNNFPGACKR